MSGESLRILHVCEPQHAGAAKVAYNLALGLQGGGVESVVCTPAGPLLEWCRAASVPVLELPFSRRSFLSYGRAMRTVRQIILGQRFDLVHAHSSFSGLLVRVARTRDFPPVVFQPHAWSFLAVDGFPRTLAITAERLLARRTDLLLCVSDDELSLGREARIAPRSAAVIPNGVAFPTRPAANLSAQRPQSLRIGCITRLATQKGVDVLLRAVAEPRWPRPSSVDVVGDGPERTAVESLAERLGVATRVRFLGQINDARQLLAGWDLFVLPSRYEAGIPLALLEAIADGLPVIATDVAGTSLLLPRDDQRLVRPGDAEGLAHAVAQAVDHWPATVSEASHTRENAQVRFGLDRQLEATCRAYQTILGQTQ